MPSPRSTTHHALFLALYLAVIILPTTITAQTPCPAPNPCTCTAELLLSTLMSIPPMLHPPTAWTPITQFIPTIKNLLDRPAPTSQRERSFLREIESATDALFASQFAAHTVAFNARVTWVRAQPLLQQLRSTLCDPIPTLRNPPTANFFASRFPPTRSVAGTLISYEALRTVIRPYKRVLLKTDALFSNFTRNQDVNNAVGAAVDLLQDIVASGFIETVTANKFAMIDALDIDNVFIELVYGWYRARKMSERRVFLAIADQVEPLANVQICKSGPVNNITCSMCT